MNGMKINLKNIVIVYSLFFNLTCLSISSRSVIKIALGIMGGGCLAQEYYKVHTLSFAAVQAA